MSDKDLDFLANEMTVTARKQQEIAGRLNALSTAIRKETQRQVDELKLELQQHEEGTYEHTRRVKMIEEIEEIIKKSEEM